MKTFFIFDCRGRIVGNAKGYATHKGAHRQANSTRTPAGRALWEAHNAAGRELGGLLWAISTIEAAKAKGYTQ
jgi:hypothetical protein